MSGRAGARTSPAGQPEQPTVEAFLPEETGVVAQDRFKQCKIWQGFLQELSVGRADAKLQVQKRFCESSHELQSESASVAEISTCKDGTHLVIEYRDADPLLSRSKVFAQNE